MTTVATIL